MGASASRDTPDDDADADDTPTAKECGSGLNLRQPGITPVSAKKFSNTQKGTNHTKSTNVT